MNNEIPLDKLVTSKSLSKPKKCEEMKPSSRVNGGLTNCNNSQMYQIKNLNLLLLMLKTELVVGQLLILMQIELM